MRCPASSICCWIVGKTLSPNTSTICRLLGRVHELDPADAPKSGSPHRAKPRQVLGAWPATQTGLLAVLARDELARLREGAPG